MMPLIFHFGLYTVRLAIPLHGHAMNYVLSRCCPVGGVDGGKLREVAEARQLWHRGCRST